MIGGAIECRVRIQRMLAQADLGEFDRMLVAGCDCPFDEFIFVPNLALIYMVARERRARAEGCVHGSRCLPCVRERRLRRPIAEIWKDRAQGGRPGHGMNERDSRVSVAGVGEKDARAFLSDLTAT